MTGKIIPLHSRLSALSVLALTVLGIAALTVPLLIDACNPSHGNLAAATAAYESPALPVEKALDNSAISAEENAPEETPVTVAVLDTGIDDTHPSLKGKVVTSINFSRSLTATDCNGHGTHIAGIIAGDSSTGADCCLMNIKVAEDDGTCGMENVARGIRFAADNGAKIINVSLTFGKTSAALDDAVVYAWKKGCVIIAAAGNSGSSNPVYPAACPDVVAVGAMDTNGRIASWSNYGGWVDVISPGTGVSSASLGGGYIKRSGTSQAAALVTRKAAALFLNTDDLNGDGQINDEVRQALIFGSNNSKPRQHGSYDEPAGATLLP